MESTRQCVVYVAAEATPPRDLEASFDVLSVRDRAAAVERLEASAVDCVVVSATAAERTETVAAVRAAAPSIPIVYTTAAPDGSAAAAATRAGATEYFAGTTAETLADRVAATIGADDDSSDETASAGSTSATRESGPHRTARKTNLRRYETIVETIDDGVLVIDADQQFAHVNEAYADLVGYDRAELLGTHASAVVDEDVWTEWMDAVAALTAGDANNVTMETELRRADGATVPVEANVTPLPGDDPENAGFVCLVRNASDRNRREETVTRLLETTRRLFSCESRTAVAETIVDAAMRTFGYSLVSVRLYDSDTDTLPLAAATDHVEERLGEREPIPVGQGPIGTAFERSDPVLLTDIADDDTYEHVHDADFEALRSSMALPIGEIGVLSVGSPEPHAFDETDRQLAQLLTASAGAALERADRRETLIRYERVLESVEEMVYALDAEGRFTLVTEPLAARVGYDRESLIGEHVSAVLDAESIEYGKREVRTLFADDRAESATFEAMAVTNDGDTFPVEIECSLLPPSDEFSGTVGAVRDITQRKEREQYLQVLNRVLRHNLRNDLTVVIGYADLLLDELEDDRLASAARTLHETATDLARTSEKARAIQYALDHDREPEPIDVATVAEAAVDSLDPDASVSVSTPASCWARADGGLSLVVENLVENAVRHAGPEPTVDVTVSAADDSVSLSVADDGPGIPESEIAVVTGDSDITQLTHSSGLGLWLVRWIVDAYDGSIRFDEGPLGGSEVTVELAREQPSDTDAAAERTLEAVDSGGPSK